MLEQAIEDKKSRTTWKRRLGIIVSNGTDNEDSKISTGLLTGNITPVSSREEEVHGLTISSEQPLQFDTNYLAPHTPKRRGLSLSKFRKQGNFSLGTSKLLSPPSGRSIGMMSLPNSDTKSTDLKSKGFDMTSVVSVSKNLQDVVSPLSNKGPKVKPFIFAKTQSAANRNYIGATFCSICNDPLNTKMVAEKIIDLQCGHYVHEECFELYTDFEKEKILRDGSGLSHDLKIQADSVFPVCPDLACRNQKKRMIPTDQTYTDSIISDLLLRQRNEAAKKMSTNVAALSSTLKNANRGLEVANDCSSKTYNHNASYTVPVLNFKHPVPLRNVPKLPTFLNKSEILMRQSSLTRSPSPNPSLSTVNTTIIKIPTYKSISSNTLKDHFIKYLIDNCPNLSLSYLLKLGTLRLVDEILVSFDDVHFELRYCYLFANYLTIWSMQCAYPIMFELSESLITNFDSKPTAIILQNSTETSESNKVTLRSETELIMEKWVVAIADPKAVFPSEVITSTVILPEITKFSHSSKQPNFTQNIKSNFSVTEKIDDAENLLDGDSNLSNVEIEQESINATYSMHYLAPDPEPDSNSDSDSDISQINKVILQKEMQTKSLKSVSITNNMSSDAIETQSHVNEPWDLLIGEIDDALSQTYKS